MQTAHVAGLCGETNILRPSKKFLSPSVVIIVGLHEQASKPTHAEGHHCSAQLSPSAGPAIISGPT